VDVVYGVPTLAALVFAFGYVRSLARRERARRAQPRRKSPTRGVRSLSQRSEMRAGDDPNTVMEDLQRTRTTLSKPHSASGRDPSEPRD
jgi:hypothetical protein